MDKLNTIVNSQATCPICTENFSFPQNMYRIRHSCCPQCTHDPICYDCCYRHIKSIISDLTSGRRSIQCPFKNPKTKNEHDITGWTDIEIRYILSRRHSPLTTLFHWHVYKPVLYSAVEKYWELWFALPLALICISSSWSRIWGFIPIVGSFTKTYQLQQRTNIERRSFYIHLISFFVYFFMLWPNKFRWMVSIAMFFVSNGRILPTLLLFLRYRLYMNRARIVTIEILNPGYRQILQDIKTYERWCVESALAKLSLEQGGKVVRCPIPNCDNLWLIPIGYRHRKENNEQSYFRVLVGPGDDRRMYCPSCNVHFCGLCLRPWTNFYNRKSHSGMSCANYSKQFKAFGNDDDGYAAIAFSLDARGCPGCSIRTQRSEGCNHITCPCGMEWCYVCGKQWTQRHYGCRDDQSSTYCTIS